MKLHQLPKIIDRSKKRVGRGIASGRGKTAGRGTKGQKARGKIPATFTGDLALYKKLPLRRGWSNPKLSSRPKIIKLSQLNSFKAGSAVDLEKLLQAKIISPKDAKRGVKVLDLGEIDRILTVKLSTSRTARNKIEKLGGKVMNG